MNEKKYKRILYFILLTMVLTIVVQCYWNYNNYLQNKQQFINQVQISLDNALELYYADLAEANQMTFIDMASDTISFNMDHKHHNTDSIFIAIQNDLQSTFKGDLKIDGVTQLLDSTGYTFSSDGDTVTKVKMIKGKKAADSIKLLKGITSIYISIQDDSLNFETLKPLIDKELKRKNFNIPFGLKHFRNDTVISSYNLDTFQSKALRTFSKTKFLKHHESLEMLYPNATRQILLKGSSGILLSLILTIAIVSCLFYLLKIIKHQKQLAEVKNDLISNITHEFKTPISTIGIALESIKDFRVIDNKEKTKNYIDISNEQLNKLNTMVEKLLETATLDSNNLELVKETANITELVQNIIDKNSLHGVDKQITFKPSSHDIFAKIDAFHFENALNNILDNAIKYGGPLINISLTQNSLALSIEISDNGNALKKTHQDKIFEKFYRIPKGNIHDVKGFGIGLYYTKKIIEKHGGMINLDLDDYNTCFKITVPNV